MKLFVRILLVGVVIIAGIFGYAAYRLNDLAEAVKGYAIAAVKSATGANVSVGTVNAKAFPSPHLDLNDVVYEKDTIKASIKRVSAEVALLPLFSGQVSITEVSADTPIVKVDASVQKTAAPVESPSKARLDTTAPSVDAPPASLPITIAVRTVSIRNGDATLVLPDVPEPVNIKNITLDLGATVEGNRADVKGLRFSALMFNNNEIAVKGETVTVQLDTKAATIQGLKVMFPGGNADVHGEVSMTAPSKLSIQSDIQLSPLVMFGSNFAPIISTFGAEGNVSLSGLVTALSPLPEATFNITLNDLSAVAAGNKISRLKSAIAVSLKGETKEVVATDASWLVNGEPMKASATVVQKALVAVINPFMVAVADGSLRGDLSAGDRIDISVQGGGFSVPKLLTIARLPLPVRGTVDGLTLNKFSFAQPLTGFKGTGAVKASALSLPGFNLFGVVLNKLDQVPALKDAVLARLPEKYQIALKASSTEFERFEAAWSGQGESITLGSLTASSAMFSIRGNGNVLPASKSGRISFTMALSPELSSVMVALLKGGTGFTNAQGEIEIPVEATFGPGGASVTPKFDHLLKGALKEAAKQILDNVLSGKAKGAKDLLGGVLGF